MKPVQLRAERTIAVPADAAWSVLARYDLDPTWRRGVIGMVPTPDGPAEVGTTTVELLRLAGKTYRNVGEVVSVGPGHRLAWRTTEGADASGARWVEPAGDGSCLVGLELTVRPGRGERLLVPVLRRILARNLAGDLRRLADLLGRGDPRLSSAGLRQPPT